MVLEKRMKKKNFRTLVYVLGILIEVIGFGLLFAFDETMSIIHRFPIIFSLIMIFFGYILAIAVRFKN